jgi:uncharacterized protein (TIGR04222 family)
MEWILDNPLASMYGPLFLLVYAVLIGFLIFAHHARKKSLDWTSKLPPLQIPANPDPYEIAYLRGGENEVARSVIFSLTQRGYLIHTKDFIKNESLFQRAETIPDIRFLTPMEKKVLYFFASPKTTKEVFESNGVNEIAQEFCGSYEERLRSEKLLTPTDIQETVTRNSFIAALVILGFGSFKFIAAIAHGRFNVIFLIIMAVVGIVILGRNSKLPRLSQRGRDYLEALQVAFARLKNSSTMKHEERLLSSPTFAGVDPMLLMVGVFGIGALSGTSYDYFPQTFQRGAQENNWSSSSCGSASACGSSCSSGGDGGGCGGGGCGGCGGG